MSADLYRNTDHRVWAAEFCKSAAKHGFDPTNPEDVEWVGTWIANAMMHGYDRAKCGPPGPPELPDGSGFAVE